MNAIAPVFPIATGARRQRGFSLIEVSIVTAILLLLAIIAIPAVGAYVIENKVPRVGEELARFVLQSQINAQPGTNQPYDVMSTSHFANTVQDSGLFNVSGSGQGLAVLHGLGVGGKVTVSAADQGASFSVTLDKVNHAACPALASVMQRVVHTISIAGGGGTATPVKSSTLDYNALTAEGACTKGDNNTFVFTAS